MITRMQPCSYASPLHLFLLFLLPFAVSPCPLHDVAVKRAMQPESVPAEAPGRLVSVSSGSPPPATPELSANQGSNLKNPPSFLRLRDTLPLVSRGTPITTFDDGLVLEVSSGVATNLPTPTRPAIDTTQNPPNASLQDVQLQTQAVTNPSGHETSAAPQLGNGNPNTVTTLPGSSRDPAALPGTVSAQPVPASSMNTDGVTKNTPGREPSTVPRTTALTVPPSVSVFTTVDSSGRTYTNSAVLSSTSDLANASADASAEPVDHSPGNEPPSGGNPPFFSQPAAAAGVIITAVVVGLALCGVFVLIRRHRRQMRKQGELQSIHSNSDYPHQRQPSGSSFSAGGRHSFQSDRSSTYEWHAQARAELEAMKEVNRTAVTYSAPPVNNGAPSVAPTYPHVQTATAGKAPARLSAIQGVGKLSPFADHEAVVYARATETALTPLAPFPHHATSVPSTYVDLSRQHHSPLLPTDTGLVPLARAPPLRMRSRSSATEPSTPSGPLSSPPPLPRVRTASAPGSSRMPPPRWNDLPLLKRTPQLQSVPSSTESTSGRNPFIDRPSLPSTTGEKGKDAQVLQERLSNPFADEDSINEDEAAVANAHARYFPDFSLPELEHEFEFGLGLGLGSSRASIEDVLGLNERFQTYTDPVNARASVLTITGGGRRPANAGMVVPIVTVQAPSNEDGISLLSTEVDTTEMMQSLDEEHLFYNGGPRSHASLTAVGAGRK